ncbi:hypothetical protein D6764_03160 [Candidatus Woesearchaeota archaeon]|nr:MAG: hypothetical protein D6764_03160 [Candidatus Woesearchaeota archaeon]
MNSRIRDAFQRVREELEEHLETINRNTNEIQDLYEFLCRIEAKVDKIAERVDELDMAVTGSRRKKSISIGNLSLREKEVATVLYMEAEPQPADRIARRTGLTVDLVENYLTSLSQKGVPVVKDVVDGVVFYSLDNDFKQLQAKENVLQINELITKEFQF